VLTTPKFFWALLFITIELATPFVRLYPVNHVAFAEYVLAEVGATCKPWCRRALSAILHTRMNSTSGAQLEKLLAVIQGFRATPSVSIQLLPFPSNNFPTLILLAGSQY
jgi:hypothetical protein